MRSMVGDGRIEVNLSPAMITGLSLVDADGLAFLASLSFVLPFSLVVYLPHVGVKAIFSPLCPSPAVCV